MSQKGRIRHTAVLDLLDRHGSLTPQMIAEILCCPTSAVARSVRVLRALGINVTTSKDSHGATWYELAPPNQTKETP